MRCDNVRVGELLSQIAAGNLGAFDELYSHTGKMIYAYILSISGNTHFSEDIKQDTYIKVIENIKTYNPAKNSVAWLIQIAKNTTLNALKRQKSAPLLFSESEEEVNVISTPSEAQRTEEEALLEYMMKILPTGSREIVVMHVYGGYSQTEIAALLKLPLTTVQWRYRAAMKKLRKYYEEERT